MTIPTLPYKNLPMQYTEIFSAVKIEKLHQKIFDIFLIFAQNIDCGYLFEPPHQGGSNRYPQSMFWSKNKNQRTNGPVNAHLRSAVYTNVIENSPSIGADEALGPFFFFRIINILSVQVFPSNYILTVYPFKYIGNPC